MDWFDGGGFGKSGERFEGGGILSELANMVARPVGYSPQAPYQSARPPQRPGQAPATAPATRPQQRPAAPPPPPAQNPYGMVRFGPGGEIIRDNVPSWTSPSEHIPMLAPTPIVDPATQVPEDPAVMLDSLLYLLETETDPARRALWQQGIDKLRVGNGNTQE